MDTVRRLDEQFFVEFDDTLAWAASRGITSGTRFHIYRKNIDWLMANDAEQDRPRIYANLEAEGRLTEIASTMTESIELVEVVPTLRQHDIDIPYDLLRRVFSGPADGFCENPNSNQPRNAMFELKMGAMAAREGLQPRLSTSNPDVSFVFEGRTVKMECKRVLSEARVRERLREGVKQLSNCVQSEKSDVGLVAISLSKLVNAGDKFLVSPDPHKVLSEQLKKFLDDNEGLLSSIYQPGVMGFIFFLSTMSYVPDEGYSSVGAGTIFPVDLDEQPFLRRLAQKLGVSVHILTEPPFPPIHPESQIR